MTTKEVLFNSSTGEVFVERSDGSASKFNIADTVTATTSPGGGIEFPGLSALTTAVRSSVPYIATHADIDSRPPRLWPVDAVPYGIMAQAMGAAWGSYDSGLRTIVRVDGDTHAATAGYVFPEGLAIRGMFQGRESLLVMTEDTTANTFKLWRTTDGLSVVHVHDMGRDPDGTVHRPLVQAMAAGITLGRIRGQDAMLFVTYSVASEAAIGTPEDALYFAYSLDDGQSWIRMNTWSYDFAAGVGERKIKHFHACRYDKWRDCWWIAAGDADAQSALIRWDGQNTDPIGNVSPEQIASGAYPGWSCRWGSQRWRAVDIVVTEEWIETYTDTVAKETGGIWRVRPDLTGNHRVNHAGKNQWRDGWFGLLTSSGARFWTGNCRIEETSPENRYVAVYGSQDGNRYFEVGQVQVMAAGKCNPRSFFELGGKIWLCSTGNVGKLTGDTTIYELRGKFREERADNIAPVFFVDFENGVDGINTGGTKATAFKTLKHALQASRVTSGARIMLTSGTSAEPGHNTIVYDANPAAAGNTTRHVQVSGQGARGAGKTRLELNGALPMRGANNKFWNVELTDLEVDVTGTATVLLGDYSTCVAGSGWTVRDCVLGSRSTATGNVCLLSSTAFTSVRSEIATTNNGTNRAIRAEGTSSVVALSTVFAGVVSQAATSKVTAKHCDFSGSGTTSSFRLEAGATVLPVIVNCIFTSTSPTSPIENLSAQTLTSANVYGCAYSTINAVGIPPPVLPAAEILDRDEDTKEPFSWSALGGIASAVGVEWDLYGRPFRARPAIGAVEIPPTF